MISTRWTTPQEPDTIKRHLRKNVKDIWETLTVLCRKKIVTRYMPKEMAMVRI